MQQVAEDDDFRHIFHGVPSIGGRYSALSNFGMVPAALMGIDVEPSSSTGRRRWWRPALRRCPVEQNPGVVLGVILGTAAQSGRDKVTIITSPGISDLGAWLEQLIAESTGKQGKGIIPVDREDVGPPEVYGNDRVFAYLRLESAPDADRTPKSRRWRRPGIRWSASLVDDIYDLGQEFFRWEIATAVAGSIIGINAFNQPDVEASKIATRKLTTEYEKTGSLPAEKPVLEDGGIKLFTDPKNAEALAKAAGSDKSLAGYLRAHLKRALAPATTLPLLGYIEMNDAHEALLQEMRHGGARSEAGGHLPGIRSALPAFHRSGLQRRTELRSVPANHLRRCRRSAGARARNTPSASSKQRRRAETSRCWPSAGAGRCASIWARRGSRPRAPRGSVSSSSDLSFVPGYCTGLHYGRRNAVAVGYRNDLILDKERIYASGNGRSGQDGRQHGAPPDARRARSRGHRSER